MSLKNLISNSSTLSSPLIAVVAGSGQIVRSASAAGTDLIIALNAGYYRNMGYGSLAAFMPYGNANDQTEQLLRKHVIPQSGSTPVVAGLFASDPNQSIKSRLETLKSMGVQGITNWPAVGFIDGAFRELLEAEGMGISAEIEMLIQAKDMGFVTFGFTLSAGDAHLFAKNGVDALILNVGLTFEIQDTIEKRDQLQLSITKAKKMLTAVHKSKNTPVSFIYGGFITNAEDFDEFIRQVPIHGYAGGSVFDRFPVMESVRSTVKSFKGISLKGTRANLIPKFGNLIGSSSQMKDLFRLIQQVAPFDVNICIDGESGTGKELVAAEIHMLSHRKNNPFITVNCGAIPDTLVESEFFGYEKGAFTGANYRKLGKFELANKGTLFLDEIADLSPHAQAALLRVIQQGEVVTLGGQKPIQVDVRIVCASNQNLEKLVDEGKFRVDLYFRLNTIIINIPPLRERKNDIPLLVANILSKLSMKFNKKLVGVTDDFMKRLKENYWAGNVRELEQVITRHALIEEDPVLKGNLPDSTMAANIPAQKYSDRYQRAQSTLKKNEFNKAKTAKALNISRKTLYIWLKQNNVQ